MADKIEFNKKQTKDEIQSQGVKKSLSDMLKDAQKQGYSLKKGKESLRWFATQVKPLKVNASSFIRSQDPENYRNTTQLELGALYCFFYDAKWKDKLPYYDKFPLVFFFNIVKNRIYGLNLHYLEPKYRAILMDELYSIESNAKLTKNKKLQITWEKIKAFAHFGLAKPCVHCYLFDHFRSKLAKIPYESWNQVIFLRTANFVGTGNTSNVSMLKVYRDSYLKSKGINPAKQTQ